MNKTSTSFRITAYLSILLLLCLMLNGCREDENLIFIQTIDENGGTITISEGPLKGAKIVFPENAVQEEIEIALREEYKLPPTGIEILKPIGVAVTINTNKEVVEFDKPVSITLPLNGLLTDVPVIGHFNKLSGEWNFIPPNGDLSDVNQITFFTDQFSTFAIFEVAIGIYELLISLQRNNELRNVINEYQHNSINCESIIDNISILKKYQDVAYNKMYQAEIDYALCKERFTCEYTFGNFAELLITFGSTEIISALIKEIGGGSSAATIKLAFAAGTWMVNLVLLDCVSCFLPNSIISKEFWQQYILYSITTKLINDLESYNIDNCLKKGPIFNPDLTYGSVTDIEGNTYKTIQIGTQTWMAENLRTTKYNDGTAIPLVIFTGAWAFLSTPAYCWYDNDKNKYAATYGALYNWYTVNTEKLCPKGWHVPSDAEWTALTTYLGGTSVAGGKMKEIGTTHWESPNTGATNSSGFSGVPGGGRYVHYGTGTFGGMGYHGNWWSSTAPLFDAAFLRYLNYGNAYVTWIHPEKSNGFSVRCLRD